MTLDPALKFRAGDPPGVGARPATARRWRSWRAVQPPGILQPGESETVPSITRAGSRPCPMYQYYSPYHVHAGRPAGQQYLADRLGVARSSSQPARCQHHGLECDLRQPRSQHGLDLGRLRPVPRQEAQYLGTLVRSHRRQPALRLRDPAGRRPGPDHSTRRLGRRVTPTPGSLSLSFSRFFSPSITGRNVMGPFGMGWSDSWQTSLAVQSDGTVVVTEPGGVQRFFQPVLSSAPDLTSPRPAITAC